MTCNLNIGGSERWVFPLTAATCLSAGEEALGCVKTPGKVFVTHAGAHFFFFRQQAFASSSSSERHRHAHQQWQKAPLVHKCHANWFVTEPGFCSHSCSGKKKKSNKANTFPSTSLQMRNGASMAGALYLFLTQLDPEVKLLKQIGFWIAAHND